MKKRKLTAREKVVSFIKDFYPDEVDKILLADGLDEAFLGIVHHNDRPVAVYGITKCLMELMRQNKWSMEEAEEYFSFNVRGAYVGDRTPLFMEEL